MALPAVVIVAGIGAAAFFGTRRLLETDRDIERLPEFARPLLRWKRGMLLAARARVVEAMREGAAERDAAERELLAEFHRRAGRS